MKNLILFVLVSLPAVQAHAQSAAKSNYHGFYQKEQINDSGTVTAYAHASSGRADYSARPMACARDALIAQLEGTLKGYTWTKVHVGRGAFRGEGADTLLQPYDSSDMDSNQFSFNFTAVLKRTNSKDHADHPISGEMTVYYDNQVDSAYHSTECLIYPRIETFGGRSDNVKAKFDETGAEIQIND